MTSTPQERYARLLAVLDAHPQARLNAVDETGLFVPLPEELRALGRPALIARSGIEQVEPQDHGKAIAAWERLLAEGEGFADLRERTLPDELTHVHFLDLRDRCGIIAAVGYATGIPVGAAVERRRERPRLGRVRKDAMSVLVEVDDAAEAMLGYPAGALTGRRTRELLHPDDHELALAAWLEMLGRAGTASPVRLRHRTADGGWLWLDVTNHNLLGDPEHSCVVADLVDVTAEMAAREDARARERLLLRLAETVPVGLVQLAPDGRVQYVNDRMGRILGVTGAGPLAPQLGLLPAADRERLVAAVARCLDDGRDAGLQVEAGHPDGTRHAEVSLRALLAEGVVEGVIASVADITEDVRLRAELEHRATYDALTGCLNRAALLQRLAVELCRVGPDEGCAVLFLDLDGFKAVNDTLGHAAGDEALCRVATELRTVARAGDAVGRLGGDEFVLVCTGVASEEQAGLLAEALTRRLRAGDAGPGPALLRASTGVAWSDDAELPADVLLGRADEAMYLAKDRAKRGRRAGAVVWSPAGRAG